MAHHPQLLRRFNQLGGVLLLRGAIPGKEREIVILRIAWNSGCVYEFGQHVLIGRREGLRPQEIEAIAGGDVTSLRELEQDLVTMVDELCVDNCVSAGTWQRLCVPWAQPELVELLLLAGFYRMVAGFLNSVGVEREPGVPGWP